MPPHSLSDQVVAGLHALLAAPPSVGSSGAAPIRWAAKALLPGLGGLAAGCRVVTVEAGGVAIVAVRNLHPAAAAAATAGSTATLRLRATATLTSMRLHPGLVSAPLPADAAGGAAGGGAATHHGVVCDGCGASPIFGVRHKRRFGNFDLCGSCLAEVALSAPAQLGLYTPIEQPPPHQRPNGHTLGPQGWISVPAGCEVVVVAAVATAEWGHAFEFSVLEAELVAGQPAKHLGGGGGGGGGGLYAPRLCVPEVIDVG
eukprot:SAG22_NODE_607_length_8603_cov_4.554327_2_plen_258_part_00